MATASERGWGDPDTAGFETTNIVTITVAGIRLRVHRAVAPLFAGFVNDIVARGYDVDDSADDWGYVNRDIRGRPGVKSNHAWGLAVDVNATRNPMTEDGKVHTDMPPWVPETAKRWGLSWGGDYTGARKDPMHFEFGGTPADAARLVARVGEEFTMDAEAKTVFAALNTRLDGLDKRLDALEERHDNAWGPIPALQNRGYDDDEARLRTAVGRMYIDMFGPKKK